MNKKLAMAMGLVLAGSSAMVSAEGNSMGLEFSANVAMTTDYVWRGMSQTDEEPAIQGGFDASHTSGIYAGTWASNVDSAGYNGSDIELDFYVGWSGDLGPVSVDAGHIWYTYPGSSPDSDFEELYVGVSKDFEVLEAGLTLYHDDSDNDYWDLGVSVPVGSFSLAAHYGWYDFDAAGSTDQEDWSIGASTELGGFGFDLTYTDTDVTGGCAGTCDDRVVFTVSKSL